METNEDHIRGVIAATCWPHCPPPGWYSAMPEPPVPPGEGKRASVDIQYPQHCGSFLAVPIPILPHRNCRRVCGTWPLGIWLWWRSGEGLATTSSQISENWVPSCNAQEVVPASGFICRAMTRELTRMQICLIQVLKTHGMAECIKKQNPMICCLKGTQRLSEEMEKIFQINGNQHKIQE